jgi:hypothetical protein
MYSNVIAEVKAIVESTIEWRRVKLRDFPDDRRLPRAISLLDGLANDAEETVPAGLVAELDAYRGGHGFGRSIQEALRHVGFSFFPRSLPEFVDYALDVLAEQRDRGAR